MSNYKDRYQFWLNNVTDEQILSELSSMSESEIQEAFSGDLSFGTAGLRGIMTAGTNRMNVYTVYRATEGLARYMQSHNLTKCAITYDSRLNSKLFSEISAATLATHGIRVYITRECMPTPFLSYMVRTLGCDTGINVTASHNPSAYNGYKVYDSDGCQILDQTAEEVTQFIEGVNLFEQPLPRFDDFVGGLIQYSEQSLENEYVNCVLAQGLDEIGDLNVVYTPLNGAGYRVVPETFKKAGLNNLTIVPEQAMPDGNFPTCSYPNPEKSEALALAKQLATSVNADIVIANDPDCDRLGVAVPVNGQYRQLTGNEVGVVLTDYLLRRLTELNSLPAKPVVVKTIVTSIMVDAIAHSYGAEIRDVLTGFKYIGNVIAQLEVNPQLGEYVFGFEESCGYLKGGYVRDKDGVIAALLVAQCASYYKKQGLSLVDRLEQLSAQHGYYLQRTESYAFAGVEGEIVKNKLLQGLRNAPITKLGDSKVTSTCDFLTQTEYDLPKADVLRYRSADGSQLIVRPSGTEPLIKCYITVCGDQQGNLARFDVIKTQTDNIFKG